MDTNDAGHRMQTSTASTKTDAMQAWPASQERFFNPDPTISVVALGRGHSCYVIDDALVRPEAALEWACTQAFEPPVGYPYPGIVLRAPGGVTQRMAEYFAQHLRRRFGARRTLDATARLSLVTQPPAELEPRQWQCHRDRVSADADRIVLVASVLYLFHSPALGGTSFYRPRRSPAQTDRLIEDAQVLDARRFSQRYGLQPGYMAGSNEYFEQIASVAPAWNRLIVYDGGLFHSADVGLPALLSADPARGRLTLNGFFTCRRIAD
jgi:hypothetical protein